MKGQRGPVKAVFAGAPQLAPRDRLYGQRRFFGIAFSSWAFALRIWIATVLALYVAFWLQLQNAYSAAVCVAILALPTRGQAFDKALYRTGGTVVGAVAALVIAGLFNEVRDLFIIAFAAWMAVCGYVASFLDGDRAYGAVLSGFTAAIIAFANIDAPQQTFLISLDRCAVILVGVLAIMIVNDLLGAPDVLSRFSKKLEETQRRIVAFAQRVVVEKKMDPAILGDLLENVVGFRTDIAVLPTESIAGWCRAEAAKIAVVAMARQISAIRIFGAVLQEDRAGSADQLDDLAHEFYEALQDEEQELVANDGDTCNPSLIAANAMQLFLRQRRRAASSFENVRTGGRVQAGPKLPRVFTHEAARRNALRLFIAMLGGSALLVYSGWPSVSNALVMLAAITAISVTAPNPQAFATNALISMLLAVTLVGVTEFLVLDGADSFPILAFGLAPAVVGASLLAASGHRIFGPVGTLTLVFMPLLFLITNPANYDPTIFLNSATLNVISVIMLFLIVKVVLPTSDDRKRFWLVRSMHREFRDALTGTPIARSLDELIFRDLDRESQLNALQPVGKDGVKRGSLALGWAELTSAAWGARLALAGLDPEVARNGRVALAETDPARLTGAAAQLLSQGNAGGNRSEELRSAAAALAWLARLIERHPADFALLNKGSWR